MPAGGGFLPHGAPWRRRSPGFSGVLCRGRNAIAPAREQGAAPDRPSDSSPSARRSAYTSRISQPPRRFRSLNQASADSGSRWVRSKKAPPRGEDVTLPGASSRPKDGPLISQTRVVGLPFGAMILRVREKEPSTRDSSHSFSGAR